MRKRLHVLLAAAAVACLFAPATPAAAEWGWQKPYNKRMNAFYTSNKAVTMGRKSARHQSTSRYHHRYPVYRAVPVLPGTGSHHAHPSVRGYWPHRSHWIGRRH